MAFLIFDVNNNLMKIAADTASKDAQNLDLNIAKVKDISDADFIKLKSNTHYATLSGDTINITENTEPDQAAISDGLVAGLLEKDLKEYHANIIEYIKFFEENNSSNSMLAECVNYKNYLINLDYSTLTFPLDNWEKYCQDNSIPYLHPLQIP